MNSDSASPLSNQCGPPPSGNRGFTMIEVVIALFITAVVGSAIFISYQAQQRAGARVRQMADMQQQMRGAFTIMAEDIRLAGYNREPDNPADQFGILDINNKLTLAYDFDRLRPNAANAAVTNNIYKSRCDDATFPSTGDGVFNEPAYSYFLSDPSGGSTNLLRQVIDPQCEEGNVMEILAENIEEVAFAFAFDNDGDGLLDRGPDVNGTSAVIWAVDTKGDNKLDTNLDLNGDGQINTKDINSSDGKIGVVLQSPAPISVPPDKIRAVRIWLLANSDPDPRYADSRTYVVGRNVYDARTFSAARRMKRRLLMDYIVDCRNMWPPAQM